MTKTSEKEARIVMKIKWTSRETCLLEFSVSKVSVTLGGFTGVPLSLVDFSF